MCIIAYCERGRSIDRKEFEECFYNNPDGAGFMYQCPKKGLVHVRKGFMTFEEFWAAAVALPEHVERVFHFRIATSGKINQGITHPFPVCNDYKRMKLLDSYSKKAMVHNGILRQFEPKEGRKASYSDTMKFNKEIIYPLGNAVFNSTVQNMIDELYGCRYVIMSSHDTAIIGNWEQSKETGILYSNDTYRPYKAVYGNWGEFGEEDYSTFYSIDFGATLSKDEECMIEDAFFNELWENGFDAYDCIWDRGLLYIYVNSYEGILPLTEICGHECTYVEYKQ